MWTPECEALSRAGEDEGPYGVTEVMVSDLREPRVLSVTMSICELCLTGHGGHCHVPACAFCGSRAPACTLWRPDGMHGLTLTDRGEAYLTRKYAKQLRLPAEQQQPEK